MKKNYKRQEQVNRKWLIDIFNPLDEVYKMNPNHPPIEIVRYMIQMAYGSVDKLKKKFHIKNHTVENIETIAEMYVTLLSTTSLTLLSEWSKDYKIRMYTLPPVKNNTLVKWFVKILHNEIREQIMVELFVSNFMMFHFPAIFEAVKINKAQQEIQKTTNLKTDSKQISKQ